MSKKEEQKVVDAKDLSVEQLKALAYDTLVEINRLQANLNQIEQTIKQKDAEK